MPTRILNVGKQFVDVAKRNPFVAFGTVGAGSYLLSPLFTSFAKSGSITDADSSKGFTLLTWNVLARPYTRYNAEHHRAHGRIEDRTQTMSRYTLAGEDILSRGCDVVLLQECEAEFLEQKWNVAAPRLADEYQVFRCSQGGEPGTAVLVRRNGRVVPRVQPGEHRCVGGCQETGGNSKIATVVPMQAGARSFVAVSTHFAYDGMADKRLEHSRRIDEAVGNASVVVAGDFNSQPGASLDALEAASKLFGRLKRAVLPHGSATGLSSDFAEETCIDHVYTSPDLVVLRAFPLARPANPYAGKATRPAKVAGASDHVPVFAELDISASPSVGAGS